MLKHLDLAEEESQGCIIAGANSGEIRSSMFQALDGRSWVAQLVWGKSPGGWAFRLPNVTRPGERSHGLPVSSLKKRLSSPDRVHGRICCRGLQFLMTCRREGSPPDQARLLLCHSMRQARADCLRLALWSSLLLPAKSVTPCRSCRCLPGHLLGDGTPVFEHRKSPVPSRTI
jgi:hypothetical protein